MERQKIDYGIDLGTTNSAVARMEHGEPVIKQTDALMDTLPSCVYFSRNKKGVGSVRVGVTARNLLHSDALAALRQREPVAQSGYIEFKREMGNPSKRYHNANMDGDPRTPEDLSAEVLKKLRSFITDEDLTAAVITVPAKFTVNQKTATLAAAHRAGITQCELLQEPIAASMAYGLSSNNKDARWLVFDLGGGTFDAALVRVEDGIMQVFDTEGDNYLGGKNLDEDVINRLLLPHIGSTCCIDSVLADPPRREALKNALKKAAEDIRIGLSFNEQVNYSSFDLNEDYGTDDDGDPIELELTVTRDELNRIIGHNYQRAIDICKTLLQRNHITGQQLTSVILVGGPTFSPQLRAMLREQITPNVDTSVNPMTVVARGAALYAATLDRIATPVEASTGTGDAVVLDVGYSSMTVEDTDWVSIVLPDDSPHERVKVMLQRHDGAWESGQVTVDRKGNVVEVSLAKGKPNTFAIRCFDDTGTALPCQPSSLTVIHGSVVGGAPLPYSIGIAVWDSKKQKEVARHIDGLEKNRVYPATGVITGLKSTDALHPGKADDVLCIPIYQIDNNGEGKLAVLSEPVGRVTVTGEDVDRVIAANSAVDLTIKVDSNEQMDVEIYFAHHDLAVEKHLDTAHSLETDYDVKQFNKTYLADARSQIEYLQEHGVDVIALDAALSQVEYEQEQGAQPRQVRRHLKDVLQQVEDLDTGTEWERLERELDGKLAMLVEDNAKYDAGCEGHIADIKRKVIEVRQRRDAGMARIVLKEMFNLNFKICRLEYFVAWIGDWESKFDKLRWHDPREARRWLDRGRAAIEQGATAEQLEPVMQHIIDQLPANERQNTRGILAS